MDPACIKRYKARLRFSALLKLVDLGAQRLDRVKPPDGALTGQTAQEPAGIPSLDGVHIPRIRTAIVDGTAPHVIEPQYPAAILLPTYWILSPQYAPWESDDSPGRCDMILDEMYQKLYQ